MLQSDQNSSLYNNRFVTIVMLMIPTSLLVQNGFNIRKKVLIALTQIDGRSLMCYFIIEREASCLVICMKLKKYSFYFLMYL